MSCQIFNFVQTKYYIANPPDYLHGFDNYLPLSRMSEEIPWALPTQQRFVLRNASLIDPVSGQTHLNSTVVVRKGLIEWVEYGSNKENGASPVIVDAECEATVELDLEGKYLCPGLIDCHVHMNAVPGEKGLYAMKTLNQNVITLRSTRMAKEMILRSFSTAQDCGGTSIALREAIREGVMNGPRLFVALNQLTQTGGHSDLRNRYDTAECCGGHVFGVSSESAVTQLFTSSPDSIWSVGRLTKDVATVDLDERGDDIREPWTRIQWPYAA